MNYFQISRTVEPKVIGMKTGTSQVELLEDKIEKNQNYIDFTSHFNGNNKEFWQKQQKVQELNPPSIKGRMRKNAKQTDLMQYGQEYSFLGYLYSEKYVEIVQSFNIGNFKAFDFDIEGVLNKYYLMFIETVTFDEINFEESQIASGYKQLNNHIYHDIKNKMEYIAFKQQKPISTFETLAIPKFYYGRDIISTQVSIYDFYSEKLIEKLLNCCITGMQIGYESSIKLKFV